MGRSERAKSVVKQDGSSTEHTISRDHVAEGTTLTRCGGEDHRININDFMRETEQARRSWRNGVFMFAFGFITGIVAVYLERII